MGRNINFDKHGFEIFSNFLDAKSVKEVVEEVDSPDHGYPKHGIRNAEKKFSSVKKLIDSKLLREKARCFLKGAPQFVRAIIFDKTPDRNWLVTWHQDKTISVDKKLDIHGWGPWTMKDGINHVQPDLEVLEDMITFRIHLDGADKSNGCLKVIPGSHKFGVLTKHKQDHLVSELNECICEAQPGDLLAMRPLLLHSSSKGTAPSQRRILHIEYSGFQLPGGLSRA